MKTIARKKAHQTHFTINQIYAGIEPSDKCDCGDPASEHLATLRKSKMVSIKCLVMRCSCNTFDNHWLREAVK